MEYHFRSLSHQTLGALWFSVAAAALLFAVVLVFYVLSPRYVEVKALVSNVTVERGQEVSVPVLVRNVASDELEKDSDIHLGGRLYALDNRLAQEGARVSIGTLAVGASGSFEVPLRVPETTGHYQLRVDLVKEGSFWFGDDGDWPATVEVVVE